MKNTFGSAVKVTLFGESHGDSIGAVIDGLTPGIEIDYDFIDRQLERRRSKTNICTQRTETDDYRIISGIYEGHTTGTPLCIVIPNRDTKSSDYQLFSSVARPGHADYTAQCKYHGYQDFRGGGHFSGRVTVALVAAGAIIQSALEKKGIYIGTHIKRCAGIDDRKFEDYTNDIKHLHSSKFSILSNDAMKKIIESASNIKAQNDSTGGIMETAVVGVPAGVGEPWFDSIESMISHAMFSIPAVKGIEFGSGFAGADMMGSQMNDEFYIGENGEILTKSNHNGGINGGITNGMPLIFRCAVKPTPSIFQEQESVDLASGQNTTLTLQGRHDPAIIHRARVVVDSVVALVLCDLLALRFGTDFPK